MHLYEIDSAILACVDPETGEIQDIERFAELQMAKDEKIENIALWIKDLNAEALAIKAEEQKLAIRRKKAERKAEQLKDYLTIFLGKGGTFDSPKVAISFRRSKAVELDDEFIGWAQGYLDNLLRYKEPEPDKTAIKEMLEQGAELPFCRLVENMSMQVK